jgi:hypothetical protein
VSQPTPKTSERSIQAESRDRQQEFMNTEKLNTMLYIHIYDYYIYNMWYIIIYIWYMIYYFTTIHRTIIHWTLIHRAKLERSIEV